MRNNVKWILCVAALLLAVPAFADVEIGRAWAGTAPSIDGVAGVGEWAGGTMTTISHGKLVTMNDGHFLYVMIDVTDDTTADPLSSDLGDFFDIAVDKDLNHVQTPNVDVLYGSCLDGRPFVMQHYIGFNTWTTCQDVGFSTAGAPGFGATANSATPHRFWEFRLDFQEIGVDPSTWTTSSGTPPKVRVNVGTHSQNPLVFLTADPDPAFFPDFSNMFQIDLAIAPPYPFGTAGPTFAGVGLIPSSYIDSFGYANINIANYYYAKDAPFGGNLNVFGNWNTLASVPGAKRYRVLYSRNGGAYTHLVQTWTNFQWNGTTWVAKAIGPDANDSYAIPGPGEIWYLMNLLISWQSSLFSEGTYNLRLEVLNNGGVSVGSLAMNSLTLRIVNTPPVVKINNMKYDGSNVCACAIVTQGDAPAGFTFDISATDANGDLNGYSLYGLTGENVSFGVASDTYSPSHVGADGAYQWNGVTNLVVPATPWRATTSCAYTFVLSASGRTQNGYGLIFPYVDYHKSLTVMLGTGSGSIAACP